ncbi:MAG TPA: hypothetical protein VI197_10785 [Polyangiaceae bacterium]
MALGMLSTLSASAAPTAWLEWQAPPECPTASDIERRVSQWLGGPVPTDTDMAVRTALIWNGERWEVTVEIAFGGQKGTRQVTVRDCQEAADFVAIAVALALDPSLAEGEDAAVPDAPEQDRPLDAPERPNLAPAPMPGEAPRARAPAARSAAPGGQSRFRPHLSVSVEGAAGTLPDPALGVGIAAGGDVGRLTFSLGARWFPPNSTTPEQAAAPIDFSLLGARAGAAYLFLGPAVRIGPSLAVDAGAIRAQQLRSPGGGVVEPWVSLAAGAVGLARLGDYVSVFSELELEVPITRPSFVLSDESVVHRVDFGARAALGLRFFFFGQ